LRALHAERRAQPLLPYAKAAEKRLRIDWRPQDVSRPAFSGRRVLEEFSLGALVQYIDWTFFFHAWELRGKFPQILDHPELGDTVEAVAREKAGIIKEGKIVISREQDADALRIVEARCADVGAGLNLEHRDWELDERLHAVGGQAFSVRGLHATYEDLFLPMLGENAARNAAAAIVACEALVGEPLNRRALHESLEGVTWPGRLEIVQRHPLIVLDGAHNPAGAEALAVALREFFIWDRLHLVISVSGNKNLDGIVAELAPLADVAYAARNENERSGDALPIAERFGAEGKRVSVHESVSAALDAARADAEESDLILVTGSLYTVADARRALGIAAGGP
jgi:dihydrofolate synthase/folylpolyglutamate synthase